MSCFTHGSVWFLVHFGSTTQTHPVYLNRSSPLPVAQGFTSSQAGTSTGSSPMAGTAPGLGPSTSELAGRGRRWNPSGLIIPLANGSGSSTYGYASGHARQGS